MTTAVLKKITRSLVAVAAFVAAGGAMAANATVQLDAVTLGTNSIGVTALGAATYNAASGVLTAPISSQTASFVDFGNGDGFKLSFDVFGLPQTISFSNFGFDVTTKTLTGNLVGTGVIASKLNFIDGDMLVAGTLTTTATGTVASNFTLAAELTSYLTSQNINPAQLGAALSVLKNVSVPPVAAVPEPSTYALMGVGLVGVALMSRRKAA